MRIVPTTLGLLCLTFLSRHATAAVSFMPFGAIPDLGRMSYASDISGDGNSIVGWRVTGNVMEAFRWTETDGFDGLGELPGGISHSAAASASYDGNVIVGDSVSSNGDEGFRWTPEDGIVGLGKLPGSNPGDYYYSPALDTSGDGSVVVGYSPSAVGVGNTEAYRWTAAGGMVGLRELRGGLRVLHLPFRTTGTLSSVKAFQRVASRPFAGLQRQEWLAWEICRAANSAASRTPSPRTEP